MNNNISTLDNNPFKLLIYTVIKCTYVTTRINSILNNLFKLLGYIVIKGPQVIIHYIF